MVRVCSVLALALVGCVQESFVIGDDRARLACQDAMTIVAPPVGCTTVEVQSLSPYGCRELSGQDHAGSWVRLTNASGAIVRLRLTNNQVHCDSDASVVSCLATATLRDIDGTPCACNAGGVVTYVVDTTPSSFSIGAGDAEILLEPLGATFEVALCAPGTIGP